MSNAIRKIKRNMKRRAGTLQLHKKWLHKFLKLQEQGKLDLKK